MNIPQSVISQIPKNPMDNSYFYHAEKAYKSLKYVYENEELYCNDHVSMIINTLERYYKGFLLSNIENNNFPMRMAELGDHDLFALAMNINKIIPNFVDCSNHTLYRENKQFYYQLRHLYTAARYEEYPSYQDFRQLYEYTGNQKNVLLEALRRKEKQIESIQDYTEEQCEILNLD